MKSFETVQIRIKGNLDRVNKLRDQVANMMVENGLEVIEKGVPKNRDGAHLSFITAIEKQRNQVEYIPPIEGA
jgi:hypothetical protein